MLVNSHDKAGKTLSISCRRRKQRADDAVLTTGTPVQRVISKIMMRRVQVDIGKDRKDDCEHYLECLDYTCKKNWDDFSCVGCEAYEKRSPIALKKAADDIASSLAAARAAVAPTW